MENKKDKIEVFYLPSYSPKMNPDERLNRDLKRNFYFTTSIKNNDYFKKKIISFLRMIHKMPELEKKLYMNMFNMLHKATI